MSSWKVSKYQTYSQESAPRKGPIWHLEAVKYVNGKTLQVLLLTSTGVAMCFIMFLTVPFRHTQALMHDSVTSAARRACRADRCARSDSTGFNMVSSSRMCLMINSINLFASQDVSASVRLLEQRLEEVEAAAAQREAEELLGTANATNLQKQPFLRVFQFSDSFEHAEPFTMTLVQ